MLLDIMDSSLLQHGILVILSVIGTYAVLRAAGFFYERMQLLSEIEALRHQLGVVLTELAEAKTEIANLSRQLNELQTTRASAPRYNENELLIVEGTARAFFEADLQALRGAGWNGHFKRLERGTQERLRQELQRRRLSGTLPRILHISAHSGAEILLNDGPAGPEFWSENLSGIEGVFFAGCANITIGDAIDGVTRWQISMREKLDNDDAAAFARAFYSRLLHMDALRAYLEACDLVPTMREYVDFREHAR